MRTALAVLLLTACGPAPRTPDGGVTVIRDLAYKTGTTEYEKERCKLDLYLPAGRKGFPVVVWFHGGGLKAGHKGVPIAEKVGRRFASEGIAVASANYRLSPKVTFPDYNRDAAAAVAWVYRNIARHGGDPGKLFVSGHSAGGYLSAIVTVDAGYLGDLGLSPAILAGSMPVSGQMDSHSTVKGERGRSREERIVDPSAPLHHARKDAPPILLIVGGKDLPNREQLNRDMEAALKKAGHPDVSLLVQPGRNHGTIISQVDRKDDAVAARMIEFVLKHPGSGK